MNGECLLAPSRLIYRSFSKRRAIGRNGVTARFKGKAQTSGGVLLTPDGI
jgi:hypothetical protein